MVKVYYLGYRHYMQYKNDKININIMSEKDSLSSFLLSILKGYIIALLSLHLGKPKPASFFLLCVDVLSLSCVDSEVHTTLLRRTGLSIPIHYCLYCISDHHNYYYFSIIFLIHNYVLRVS